jgi:hypothetical protein
VYPANDKVKGVEAVPAVGNIDAVPGEGVPVHTFTPSPYTGNKRAVDNPPPEIEISVDSGPSAVGENLTYIGTPEKPGTEKE